MNDKTTGPQTGPQTGTGKWTNKMPQDRHLFIVTYGRSGSTLLQNLVNSIPGYEIRGENNNALLHYFRAWKAIEGSETLTQMRNAKTPTDQTHPWFGGEKIFPKQMGRTLTRNFVANVLLAELEPIGRIVSALSSELVIVSGSLTEQRYRVGAALGPDLVLVDQTIDAGWVGAVYRKEQP